MPDERRHLLPRRRNELREWAVGGASGGCACCFPSSAILRSPLRSENPPKCSRIIAASPCNFRGWERRAAARSVANECTAYDGEAMTHPSHQTNGASLEDCHTNFFALVSDQWAHSCKGVRRHIFLVFGNLDERGSSNASRKQVVQRLFNGTA